MVRSIKTSLFIIILISSLNKVHSQDGVMWGYNVTFQFDDFKKIGANMPVINVEFFVENTLTPHSSRNIKSTDSFSYKFHYSYNGPGGRPPSKTKPQNIYLRISIEYNQDTFEKQIPFVFNEIEGTHVNLIIDKIDLQNYLRPWSDAIAVIVENDGSYSIVKQSELDEKLIPNTLVKIPINSSLSK